MAVHAGFGGGNQFRVVRQAKVVIGAEIDDMTAVADGDIRLLRGCNNAFFFE